MSLKGSICMLCGSGGLFYPAVSVGPKHCEASNMSGAVRSPAANFQLDPVTDQLHAGNHSEPRLLDFVNGVDEKKN